MNRPIPIVIPIYPGVTHLDFTGPHQFLSRVPEVAVTVASLDAQPVVADGLEFSGLADLRAISACEVLLVPGGLGCVDAIEDAEFMAEIHRLAGLASYHTSVCTGSLILGAAGLLKGRRAACHWAWREMLSLFGAIPDPGRVVRDGHVLTGGGVTAGIDFALTLVAELVGEEAACAAQLALEYAPAPPLDSGRPETAPAAVLERVAARLAQRLEDGRRRLLAVADRS